MSQFPVVGLAAIFQELIMFLHDITKTFPQSLYPLSLPVFIQLPKPFAFHMKFCYVLRDHYTDFSSLGYIGIAPTTDIIPELWDSTPRWAMSVF